jgi:predicted NBD/HSP70 family sugar kinase
MDDIERARDEVIIGIDVGASTIAGGLVTSGGDVLAGVQSATHAAPGSNALDGLLSTIHRLQGEARARGIRVRGVGVGLPGLVDVDRGMIVSDLHLIPELTRVPIGDRIREQTGLPAWADNDVNALALGEARQGAGVGVRSLVVLAIGTGIGGALILDGTLVRGHSGYAGEFGHMTVMLNGPACMCGIHGCVCLRLGGEMIACTARTRAVERPHSKILALAGGDPAAITTLMVFQAAEAGDDVALGIADETYEALGAALGTILNGLNPELLVITGGVAKSLLPMENEIRRRAAKYALADVLADTTIRLLPSDKSSSMRGAAALFLYESSRRTSPSWLAPARGH